MTGIGQDAEIGQDEAGNERDMAVDEMETDRPGRDGLAARCHWMLLRLAGYVPDEMLTLCRQWLAEGRYLDLATTVTHTAVAYGVAMTSADRELIERLHRDAGARDLYFTRIPIEEIPRAPVFEFAPRPPTHWPADEVPVVDLGAGMGEAAPADAVTEALVEAARANPDVQVAWEAWRFPENGAPWPPPRRIFVVEVAPVADLPAVTALLQQALAAAGEVAPQVEVYLAETEPPPYLLYARAGSGERFVRQEHPEIQLLPVFDGADDNGPWFDPDHPRLSGDERVRVLNYLSAGAVLMQTSAQLEDVLEPGAGEVVPMSFRTDGAWIWSDATWYYLNRHGLAPEQEFLDHARDRDFVVGEVDAVAFQRATAALRAPADAGPA